MTPEQQAEALALLAEYVRRDQHANDCAFHLHRQHGRVVFGNGPRRGKFGREIEGERERFNQEVREYEARAPKCNCFVGRAQALVNALKGE